MERVRLAILAFFLTLLPATGFSAYYGATFSYDVFATEPENLRGYQFLLSYDPQCFKWRHFNLYFDGGFSRLWVPNQPYFPGYSSVNIYSLSPVFRYSFKKRGPISPYLEISIGAAYINRTKIDDRNFGMHPSFQDRLGVGFYVGNKDQFSLGLHAVHYSNARLASHNNGMTIPIEIDIGYRYSM
jgi:hypothetical protein